VPSTVPWSGSLSSIAGFTMVRSVRLQRWRIASAVAAALIWIVSLPAVAQASDISLTVDPEAYSLGSTLVISGTVTCSSPLVDAVFDVTARQGSSQPVPYVAFGHCDPSTGDAYWVALFAPGSLSPGKAFVTVTLTLNDGTTVTASGSV
jgi:hypothetical protein